MKIIPALPRMTDGLSVSVAITGLAI